MVDEAAVSAQERLWGGGYMDRRKRK